MPIVSGEETEETIKSSVGEFDIMSLFDGMLAEDRQVNRRDAGEVRCGRCQGSEGCI